MENKNSMKKLWHGIKSSISNNCSFSSIGKIEDQNGNLMSNPSEIPNIFNDVFVIVRNESTRYIPETNKSPIEIFAIEIPSEYFFHQPLLLKSIERL